MTATTIRPVALKIDEDTKTTVLFAGLLTTLWVSHKALPRMERV